jgi:hypothetical protein
MLALTRRLAFAFVSCALAALPAACSSGGNALPSAIADGGPRAISSGGSSTNTGGGGGGGGGGTKAPAPGAMPFTSGCGAMDSVSSAVTATAGFPTMVTITTKMAEHNCVDVFFRVDYVNASTGQTEFGETCFNFTNTPYTCSVKFKTAQLSTTYQTVVTVWNATLAAHNYATPIDPAWLLGTESLTVTTPAAAPPISGV